SGNPLAFNRRVGTQESDDRQLPRLLRARRERPRRDRSAEQRDESAPFHCLTPPALPTERIAHLRGQEVAAVRDFKPAYVGSGSGASNWCRSQHFHFTPTS